MNYLTNLLWQILTHIFMFCIKSSLFNVFFFFFFFHKGIIDKTREVFGRTREIKEEMVGYLFSSYLFYY